MHTSCFCLEGEEERIAARHSRRIDEGLEREREQRNRELKILLLGASESGKSTLLKQMRIFHGEDYTIEERLEFRPIIYHNILKGMKTLVDSQRKLGVGLGESSNEDFCDIVASHPSVYNMDSAQFSQCAEPLRALWRDKGMVAHKYTGLRVPDPGVRIPNSEFRIPNFEFRIPNFEFRIPNSGIRITKSERRIINSVTFAVKWSFCEL